MAENIVLSLFIDDEHVGFSVVYVWMCLLPMQINWKTYFLLDLRIYPRGNIWLCNINFHHKNRFS